MLDYLDFGSLPSKKWWTTEIIELSCLDALRLESLQSVVELGTPICQTSKKFSHHPKG